MSKCWVSSLIPFWFKDESSRLRDGKFRWKLFTERRVATFFFLLVSIWGRRPTSDLSTMNGIFSMALPGNRLSVVKLINLYKQRDFVEELEHFRPLFPVPCRLLNAFSFVEVWKTWFLPKIGKWKLEFFTAALRMAEQRFMFYRQNSSCSRKSIYT